MRHVKTSKRHKFDKDGNILKETFVLETKFLGITFNKQTHDYEAEIEGNDEKEGSSMGFIPTRKRET